MGQLRHSVDEKQAKSAITSAGFAKISAARAFPFVPKLIKIIHTSTWIPKNFRCAGSFSIILAKKKITHIKLNIEHTKIVRIDKKFCKQMLKISSNFQFWHCKRNFDPQKFLALRARTFFLTVF